MAVSMKLFCLEANSASSFCCLSLALWRLQMSKQKWFASLLTVNYEMSIFKGYEWWVRIKWFWNVDVMITWLHSMTVWRMYLILIGMDFENEHIFALSHSLSISIGNAQLGMDQLKFWLVYSNFHFLLFHDFKCDIDFIKRVHKPNPLIS